MSEQKNLIIAIVLSVAILFAFQYFFGTPKMTKQATAPTAATTASTENHTGTTPAAKSATSAHGTGGASASRIGNASGLGPHNLKEALARSPRIKIENGTVRGSIALDGALIDHLELLDYHQTVSKKSPVITLLSPPGSPHPYYASFGWTAGAGAKIRLPGPDTTWKSTGGVLSPDHPVTLTWNNGQGLGFAMIFSIDKNYMFHIEEKVENQTGQPVTLYPYGLIARDGTPKTLGYYLLHEGPLGVFNGTLSEYKYKTLREDGKIRKTSTGGWIGITGHYWLAALIPDPTSHVTANFRYAAGGPYKNHYQVDYLGSALTVPAHGTGASSARLFAGAKEVQLLNYYAKHDHVERFDLAIDWGWFYFLTKPIFYALDYLNAVIGNFGLAILALTTLIKLVFFPLAQKSYRAMTEMKRLQPRIAEIREQYADDKTKMNQAVMELYKRAKVNPAAGCLPVLLQVPVFFALYKVLFVTIEMRHAPFYGWIHDLSAPDPTSAFNLFGLIPWTPPHFLDIGAWPLMMGVSMFLQQRLNPTPPDPVQAKLFLLMPIFFTYLLAHFPAGLVIYWTWNNLLSMTQQWLIMRQMGVKA